MTDCFQRATALVGGGFVIDKRLLPAVLFGLVSSMVVPACQGGNANADAFHAPDDEIAIDEPPDDGTTDPDVVGPPLTTEARCRSLCDVGAVLGCPTVSNNNGCPASCRRLVEDTDCGLEAYDLIACMLDTGVCPPEDDEDPTVDFGDCSEQATSFAECEEASQ